MTPVFTGRELCSVWPSLTDAERTQCTNRKCSSVGQQHLDYVQIAAKHSMVQCKKTIAITNCSVCILPAQFIAKLQSESETYNSYSSELTYFYILNVVRCLYIHMYVRTYVHNGGHGLLSSKWRHNENDAIMRTGAESAASAVGTRRHNENDITMRIAGLWRLATSGHGLHHCSYK